MLGSEHNDEFYIDEQGRVREAERSACVGQGGGYSTPTGGGVACIEGGTGSVGWNETAREGAYDGKGGVTVPVPQPLRRRP